MNIKIMFDGKVITDIEVKNAEISASRDIGCIYKTSDFKKTLKHKPYELIPSAKSKICIDYEVLTEEMPNSEFYLMSCNSLPEKIKNVITTCPKCAKDIKIRI